MMTTLNAIAKDIHKACGDFASMWRSTAKRATHIGELLLAAKAHRDMKHGQFKVWCEAETPYSYSRCKEFMRLSKGAESCPFDPDASVDAALAAVAASYGETQPKPKPDIEISSAELSVFFGAQFGTIYADPPWKYGNQGTRAATDNHYPTMTVDEICELPVEQIAAENAHLHLWTTNAFLFDAQRVIEAWGFEYKSCRLWVKPNIGIGNYWRVSHEFLLFGVRGKCPFMDRSLRSWVEAKRTEHSVKPGVFRDDIGKASPAPRIELFARTSFPEWSTWGNQITPHLFQEGRLHVVG